MFTPTGRVGEDDRTFVRRLGIAVAGWTAAFVVASVGLVRYGDVLMALFT